MITGEDTFFIAPGEADRRIKHFLDDLGSHWPDMRVRALAGRDLTGETDFVRWRRHPGSLAETTGSVQVVRDKKMERFFVRNGYALDRSGEGPFNVIYQPFGRDVTQVIVQEHLYVGDDGERYDPFTAHVVTAHLSSIDVVTPDLDSAFTKDVFSKLTAALAR